MQNHRWPPRPDLIVKRSSNLVQRSPVGKGLYASSGNGLAGILVENIDTGHRSSMEVWRFARGQDALGSSSNGREGRSLSSIQTCYSDMKRSTAAIANPNAILWLGCSLGAWASSLAAAAPSCTETCAGIGERTLTMPAASGPSLELPHKLKIAAGAEI